MGSGGYINTGWDTLTPLPFVVMQVVFWQRRSASWNRAIIEPTHFNKNILNFEFLNCLLSIKRISFAKTCPTLLQKAEGSGYPSPCQCKVIYIVLSCAREVGSPAIHLTCIPHVCPPRSKCSTGLTKTTFSLFQRWSLYQGSTVSSFFWQMVIKALAPCLVNLLTILRRHVTVESFQGYHYNSMVFQF